MAIHKSIKHSQISKAEGRMLATVGIAIIICVFSLFGIKAMISKGAYQRKVVNEKHQVVKQLQANYDAAQKLVDQYQIFASQDPNILGGDPEGTGNLDGDNARIVLDALPSKYDAPALASSIEKLLSGRGVSIRAIDVKDDPASNPDEPQALPQVLPMNFSFEGISNFAGAQAVIADFEKSIRPFDVTTLQLSGADANLIMTVNMTTYFQPAKSLDLSNTKVVR